MSGNHEPTQTTGAASIQQRSPGSWSLKYGNKHALRRITVFPPGIIPPKRVRLYLRADHFVLQWWDPSAGRNLSDRNDGDLVAAIMHARGIEERLDHFNRAGQENRRLKHEDLVGRFMTDLDRRANAGVIDPASVRRYHAALRHYLAFTGKDEVRRAFPHVCGVNKNFSSVLSPSLPTALFPPTAALERRPDR